MNEISNNCKSSEMCLLSETCFPAGIEAMVASDIAARQRIGILKYGITVANNPLPLREWLEHAYQEALDLPIYLKRAIEEIDRMKMNADLPDTTAQKKQTN